MSGERHRAKRSLGQNFLVDANLQRKIVDAVGADADDEVLEIGPGKGALTRHLAGTVRRLVLVEIDDGLAPALAGRFGDIAGVEVVHADVLATPVADHLRDPTNARIVGNIPYNITTPIIFHLLTRPRPARIVLMVQDEVAARLTAEVGTKAYGALSVGVRAVANVERLFRVGRGAFRPVPKVHSAVVAITPHRPERTTPEQEERLRTLVRALFQWRRKQLAKTLRDHPDLGHAPAVVEATLAEVGVAPTERPERLAPEQLLRLSAALP